MRLQHDHTSLRHVAAYSDLAVLGASAMYVCVSVVSTVYMYKELQALGKFPNFANELNTAAIVILCILSAVLLSPWLPVSSNRACGRWGSLQGRLLEPWTVVWLGLLNALQNTLQIVAIDRLGPRFSTLTTLAAQAVIPFTLLFGASRLGSSYSPCEIFGAATVVAGVSLAVVPHLSVAHHEGDAGQSFAASTLLWLLIFTSSTVPQALLNVVIEQRFAEENAEAATDAKVSTDAGGATAHENAQATDRTPQPLATDSRTPTRQQAVSESQSLVAHGLVVTIVRTLLLVAGMNVVSLPANVVVEVGIALASDGAAGLEALQDDYTGGWTCLTKRQSPSVGSTGAVTAVSSGEVEDCGSGLELALKFAPLGTLFIAGAVGLVHVAGAAPTTRGSGAAVMFLVCAFCLPIQNFALSARWVMGPHRSGVSDGWDWAGLAVICVGIVSFALGGRGPAS